MAPPIRDTRLGNVMAAIVRKHGPPVVLLALLAVAVGLRLPWLGAIPNPAGDEGNWAWYGHRLVLGWSVELQPDARFVTLTFARMIAVSYRIFGASFAAARAVLVLSMLGGMLCTWLACMHLGLRRAGIAMVAVLAVHPWAVFWSRTVTVPYAIDLAVGVAGPLCLLAALRARSSIATLLAVQLIFVGVQFSPLGVIPVVACGLWCVLSRAWNRVRWPTLTLATLLGGLHVVPVALGALGVAHRGSTRPSHQFNHLGARLCTYTRTVFGGLGGEATVRHFTGNVLSPWLEGWVIVAVIAVLARALVHVRERENSPRRDLTRYAALHLAVALVGLPLLLATARPWNLPAIDAERYLFAVLAPAVLCVGALAERARGPWVALAVVGYLALGPTRRIAQGFLTGGGPDHGFYLLAGGGGYRGWKVPRERIASEVLIRDAALAVSAGRRTTVVMGDYALHPLHFVDEGTGLVTLDLCKFPLTVHPRERYVFATYSPGLFARGFGPAEWLDCNRRVEDRMRSTDFDHLRRLRTLVQSDGAPLLTLWTADGADASTRTGP